MWRFTACVLLVAVGCGSQSERRTAGFDIVFNGITDKINDLNVKNMEQEIDNAFGSSVKVLLKRPAARNTEVHVYLEFPGSLSTSQIAETIGRIDDVKSVSLRYSKFDEEQLTK